MNEDTQTHDVEYPWRATLVATLLPINVLSASVLPVVIWVFTSDLLVRVVVDAVLLVILVASVLELTRPRLGTRGRAWLLVLGFLVLTLLGYAMVGFIAACALLACATLLVARVLLGRRALLVLVCVLFVSTSLIAWATVTDWFPWQVPAIDVSLHEPAAWMRTIIISIFLLFFIGLLVGFIVDKVEATMRDNARLYREAQQALRLRDEFLSIASHELRTPIATLKLASEGLSSGRIPATPQNLQRSLGLVRRNVERLTVLVGQLLDVSRIETGHLDLVLEDVELSALVREVVELFGERSGQQGALSVEVESPARGRWDRSRLEQVVTALVANALEFGAGKPVEVSVRCKQGFALLEVRDRGVGIPPELVPHIFERFARGSRPQRSGGLGLGLFIVRSIVEAMGGTIRVDSIVGEGTTFTVALPASDPHPAGQSMPGASP